jgi:hypothetical protein
MTKKRAEKTPAEPSPASPLCRWVWTIVVIAVSAFFLFTQLGHYALWDDEAGVVLPARGVWQTGDTSIKAGHNIVAIRSGYLDRDLKDRANPPLPAWILAPFAGISGTTTWIVRFPIACCGMLCVLLLLYWMWRDRVDSLTWGLMSLALLGNVSFFLYYRQARYYGLTILFSVLLAYLYLHWNGSRRRLLGIALVLTAVIATHYMTAAGLGIVLLVDYFIWQRHVRALTAIDWLVLLVPPLVLGGLVFWVFNPFLLPGLSKQAATNNFFDHLTLFFWNLRDLNRCEFAVGVCFILAPMLYCWREKNSFLLRGPLALLVYCFIVAMVSPQPVAITSVADVRYMIPLIPLGMYMGAQVVRLSCKGTPVWVTFALGALVFGTNLFQGGLFFPEGIRSTPACFVGELLHPPSDPYTETAKWINANVHKDESIWVLPDEETYPLIYHAPDAIYAWQLPWPADHQFDGLPDINFQGRSLPDYILCFGPTVVQLGNWVQQQAQRGTVYQPYALINFFWKDSYRPELFWRSFDKISGYDPQTQAIYVFRLVSHPANPPKPG